MAKAIDLKACKIIKVPDIVQKIWAERVAYANKRWKDLLTNNSNTQ